MIEIKVLEGYLKTNEKKYGDASHVGQMNINGNNHFLYGWFEEKELTDEYGKAEKVKYFKLWTTDNKNNVPHTNLLAQDAGNIGYLYENTERETNKHPMYKGEIKINGRRFFLASWKNSKKEMVNGDLVIKTIFALKISVPNNNNNHEQSSYNEQEVDYSNPPF